MVLYFQRAGTHSVALITLIILPVGVCVYTNTVPGGAFRGFGVTQTIFGQEQNIDELAALVGMDPFRNSATKMLYALATHYQTDKFVPKKPLLVECLEAVKDAYYASNRTGLAVCLKSEWYWCRDYLIRVALF